MVLFSSATISAPKLFPGEVTSPPLSSWKKTEELFSRVVKSPYFWATIAVASTAIAAVALAGLLNVTLVPLIAIGSTGLLASGVTIYLLCKNNNQPILKAETVTNSVSPPAPSPVPEERKQGKEEAEREESSLRSLAPVSGRLVPLASYPFALERKEAEEKSFRLKMAAHLFGGAGIGEAGLGDLLLEGYSLGATATSLLNFLKTSPERIKENAAFITLLEQLTDASLFLERLASPDAIISRINDLSVGDNLILPGGWKGSPGHAMIYQIRRDGADSFTFTVTNSGAGIENHPRKRTHNKVKYAPSIYVESIPLKRMVAPATWSAYLLLLSEDSGSESNPQGKPFRNSNYVYNHFLNCFAPDFAKNAKGVFEDYITPQKAGTCSNDVLFALMRSLSPNVPGYKHLKNEYKFWGFQQYLGLEIQETENSLGSKSLDVKQIAAALGRIDLIQYLLDRFAKSIHKALKSAGEITVEEGESYLTVYRKLAERVQGLKNGYRTRLTELNLGVDRSFGMNFVPSVETVVREEEEKVAGALGEQPGFDLRIDYSWGSGVDCVRRLETWRKAIGSLTSENKIVRREAHLHLQSIFMNMPKASDPFWRHFLSLPGALAPESKESKEVASLADRGDLEKIIFHIAELHKEFHVTMEAIEVGDRRRLIDSALIKKNTQVISLLCSKLLMPDGKLFTLGPKNSSASSPLLGCPEEVANSERYEDREVANLERYRYRDAHLEGRENRETYRSIAPQDVFELFNVKVGFHYLCQLMPSYGEAGEGEVSSLVKLILDNISKDNLASIKDKMRADPSSGLDYHSPWHIAGYALCNYKEYLPKIFEVMIQSAWISAIDAERCYRGSYDIRKLLFPENATFDVTLPESISDLSVPLKISPEGRGVRCSLDIAFRERVPLPHLITLHRPFIPGGKDKKKGRMVPLFDRDRQGNVFAKSLPDQFDRKLLLARASGVNIAYRARALINGYLSCLDTLCDRDEQLIFESLIFECGVLKEALALDPRSTEEGFSALLSRFVMKGYRVGLEASEVATQLFFLRLGSYFSSYIKDARGFPDLMEETGRLLRDPTLSDEGKALVLRERLAYQGRMTEPLTLEMCRRVLEEQVAFQSLEISLVNQDFKLDENIDRLGLKIRQFFIGKSEKEVDEVVAPIFGRSGGELRLPYIYSKDRRYFFNLVTLQLFYEGGAKIPLPKDLERSDSFRKCFVQDDRPIVKDVTGDGFKIAFTDRFGNRCKATKKAEGEWTMYRTLEGCSYQYVGFSGEKRVPLSLACSMWQDSEGRGVLVDEKTGDISYRYTRGGLRCNLADERRDCFLIDKAERDPHQVFFRSFDPQALFWKSERATAFQVVELPSYNLKIVRENERYLLKAPYEGYELDPLQFLPFLSRICGALVIRKGGERRVLVPGRVLEPVNSGLKNFSEELRLRSDAKRFYEYKVDSKGRLRSDEREASLHLAYLYLIQRHYREALRCLHAIARLEPFTKSEVAWLDAIDTTRAELLDPRASAIRLLVKLLRLENINTSDASRSQINLLDDLENYINNISDLPSPFLIEPRRIRSWAPPGGFDSIVVDSYLKLETGIPVSDRAVAVEVPKTEMVGLDYMRALALALGKKRDSFMVLVRQMDEFLKQDPRSLITRKECLAENFLMFYMLAQRASKKGNEEQVRALLYLSAGAEKEEQQLLQVLLEVLKRPTAFPPDARFMTWDSELNRGINQVMRETVRVAMPSRVERVDYSGYRRSERAPPVKVLFKYPDVEVSGRKSAALDLFGGAIAEKEEKKEKESKAEADSLSRRLFESVDREAESVAKEGLKAAESVAKEGLKALVREVEAFRSRHATFSYPRLTEENVRDLLVASEGEVEALLKCEQQIKERIEVLGNKEASDRADRVIDAFGIGAKLKRRAKVEDFLIAYVRGDFAAYQACNRHLSEEEARSLHNEIGQLLLIGTERQRLERYHAALRHYQGALSSSLTTPGLLNEYAQNILNEMNAVRHYKIEDHPEYLLFEYKRHIALRKEQVEGLNELLKTGGQGSVLQLIMGGGKTDVMAILLAIKKANGENLSMMMVPEELMPDFSKNIEKQGRIFRNVVTRLNWSDVSLTNLEKIHAHLTDIIEKRKVLIVSDVEIKRFLLAAQEALIQTAGDNKKQLEVFRAIKQIFQKQTSLTIDEIHKQDSRHDCRIAVGASEVIASQYFRVSMMLYDLLMYSPAIADRVYFEFSPTKGDRAEPFTPELFETIRGPLLEAAFEALSEEVRGLSKVWPRLREDIIRFLTERTAVLPDFSGVISDRESIAEVGRVLCLLKGQLEILPETLSKRLNERYGIFPPSEESGENVSLAGPFKSARTPNLGSQFGNYVEWINYTIQANAKEISLAAFKKEIQRIQMIRREEIRSRTPTENSDALREYRLLVGEACATSFQFSHRKIPDQKLEELLLTLNRQKDFRHRFIERYILPAIRPQTNVLVCDAQNLFGAFRHVTGYTGTPKEELALKFDVKKAPGTDGQVISLIDKNSRDKLIVMKEADSAETHLRVLLAHPGQEHFHALIDAGALFKDLAPRRVAEMILSERRDLEAVTYYEESPQGPVEKMLRRGIESDSTPVEVDKARLFVFFGQNQCTGINKILDPSAHAFLTTNPAITYTQLSQGAMRMRGLAKGQCVHLVATDAQIAVMKKKLDKREVDSVDCCLFAKIVEAQKGADDNLLNVKQQMRQIVMRAIGKYLDEIPLESLSAPAHRALCQLLITKTTLDPLVQFGSAEQILDLEEALDVFARRSLEGLNAWYARFHHEIVSEHAALISPKALHEELASLIKAIKAKRNQFKEKVTVSMLSDQGSEVAVKTETRTEQAVKQEEEQKVELEINQRGGGELHESTEALKINIEHLASRETLKIERLEARAVLVTPLSEAVGGSDFFTSNFYVSDSFAQTFKHHRPFQVNYKPLTVCLIERSYSNPTKMNMISITESEATAIEVYFRNQKRTRIGDFEYCLYYPNMEYAYPEALPGLEENREFQNLCMQYLVLAGTIHIPPKYRALLKEWLRTIPDLEAFEKFYLRAMAKEPEVLKSYPTSFLKAAMIEIQEARLT